MSITQSVSAVQITNPKILVILFPNYYYSEHVLIAVKERQSSVPFGKHNSQDN